MFDRHTRLSLDELQAPFPSLPPRSTSSLAWSTNFASKIRALKIGSMPKQTAIASPVRAVRSEDSDVERLEKTPASTSPLPSSSARMRSTLISHSVENLSWTGYYQSTDQPCLSTLHSHPFSQASTCDVDAGCSSSIQWLRPLGSVASSSVPSDPPRPPSSASFMDMGENTKGKRSYSCEDQSSSRPLGKGTVSDADPLLAYRDRKSGRDFWRALIRPSVLSFLDNSRHPQTGCIPAERGGLQADAFFSTSCDDLPPRPAPYFYPRRVDGERDDISHDVTTHSSFFCNLAELPIDSPPDVSIHRCRYVSKLRKTRGQPGLCDGGRGESASVNSDEIETWKKQQQTILGTKKSRFSLRQRFGLSLKQSIGFQHIRSAISELDLSQFARPQDETEALGPGITDDPFATLSTPPQLLPATTTSSSSISASTAASLPLLCFSEPDLDFETLDSGTKRNSFMIMNPDCDEPSTSSSISRSDTTLCQPSPPSYSNLSCLSDLTRSTQHNEGMTPTSITQSQSGHASIDSGIMCYTPLLTPDVDSIEAWSPLFPTGCCAAVEAPNFMHEQDLSKIQTSIVPFPSLHASQASPTIEDPFKETAVAEGASVDQISYSCARGLPLVSSVSLDLVSNKSPESHRKSSPRGVGGECIADVSTTSIDVPESIADFTLLAIDWPQPPCHISTEPDTTRGVKSDSERFTFINPNLANPNRLLGVRKGEQPPTSLMPDMLLLEEAAVPLTPGTPRRLSSTSLSSIDFVEVTLGSSIFKHLTLPKIIILSPITEAQPTTSITFHAVSRPVLISFLAFHAETRLEARDRSRANSSILANVLCRETDPNQGNRDTTTITLLDDTKASQSKSANENESVTFPLGLPITLGELAVAIAKVSFRKGIVLDG